MAGRASELTAPLSNEQQVDSRGIPLKSDYPSLPVPALYSVMTSIALAVGLGIAYAVYAFGARDKYDAKIDLLAGYDLGWVYMGLFVIKIFQLFININLGMSRKAAKVNVPDQQVYKVGGDGAPQGYVLMELEGDLGRFNRAQRALQNYIEGLPIFLAFAVFVGFVFPFPAFVLIVLFMASKTAYAVGYTKDAKSRMKGGMISMICSEVLQGLLLVAGVKAILRAA